MAGPDFPLEPWRHRIPIATVPKPKPPPSEYAPRLDIGRALVTTEEIAHVTDKIVTARILTNIARERRLSIAGKMAALTERAKDFNTKTEGVLDGIAEKITKAEAKRDTAAEKHHAYYDLVIAGVDESISAIERLSNGPLSEGGGS